MINNGKFWIPPHIKRILDEQLELNLHHPDLFSAEAGVPPRKVYFVSGRPGLHKAEAIMHLVSDFRKRDALYGARPEDITGTHRKGRVPIVGKLFEIPEAQASESQITQLETILQLLGFSESPNESWDAQGATMVAPDTPLVLLLDKGHNLPLSSDPAVRRIFNETIPSLLKTRHVLMIVCCDCTMAQLPRETQVAYQYERQLFFPTPDDEWRKQYFRHRFTVYEGFVLQRGNGRLHIVFDKENTETMFEYLVDCSGSATIQEMDDFCAALFNSLHRIAPPDASVERHLDATGCFRVLNWERCKEFLVDRGGCYCISRVDGEALEQEYSLAVAGNRGLAPERERLPETKIGTGYVGAQAGTLVTQSRHSTSRGDPHAATGGGVDSGLKLLKSESERITFDKDGHEIPVSGPISLPVEDSEGPTFDRMDIKYDVEPESKKLKA